MRALEATPMRLMRPVLLLLSFLLCPALPAHATFSIVAIDPVTGDLKALAQWLGLEPELRVAEPAES